MKTKSLIVSAGLAFAALGLALPTNVMAQKQFTLEELNFGGKNFQKMRAETRYTTWWGDQLVRMDNDRCTIVNPQTLKETTLFTLDDINAIVAKDNSDRQVRSLYSVSFPYADRSVVKIATGKETLTVDFKAKKLESTMKSIAGVQAQDYNKVSGALAYVLKDQLYVVDKNGTAKQLTNDGSRSIVYGQAVHRDEFGIKGGLYWSPSGNRLAFYRMDQSMVTDYPLVHIPEIDWKPAKGESRIATPEPTKYPMAGETSHKVTVGVYDINTGKTVYLDAGDPTDRYFTNIQWSPDSKTIYMFELNRDQNDCRLVSYNAETGSKITELYRETDAKYVEPSHPILFLPWNADQFVMQTQKDGYNHLYLFNKDGKQIKQITKGNWVVMDVLGFNNKTKSIIYVSNECSPIQRNTWSVSVENGARTLLDNGRGYHYATLSGSGKYLVDNYTEPTVPRRIDIITATGAKPTIKNWLTAKNPWAGYNVPEFTSGSLKADDGTTDLYWRMVKPIGFDPSKKYPTVVYVYGGPHAHNVDASWNYGSRSWETYMAQKGYLLFILDNRGSENRGRAFEQATFRQLGQVEMRDQMQGVKYLKSLPYVDADRIGVHGWSFGGFMTISLITNYPETFKVGVAGGPVIDWKWYEAMYGERYMDTPESNPEGYAKTSLLPKAKDLKGKLQIITGMNDPVVLPQHCLSFLKACIAAGTQPDFFVYPGEPHNMRGHQSVHLHERITQYFEDYLK
ncbi:DPP IV N-terminal domain-containing protein [Prevotella aurantiaca]|uniref:S9 family peptidase n=1 Tax=Prevotella aurantiaca TaxID=596085 RepID=UPI0028EAAE67|nr:DPP IV N-terminal domain-containing protein [Prevotella aurantiaca]